MASLKVFAADPARLVAFLEAEKASGQQDLILQRYSSRVLRPTPYNAAGATSASCE